MSMGKFKPTNASAKIEVTHLAVPTVQYNLAFSGKYKAINFSIDITASSIDEYCPPNSCKKNLSLQSVQRSGLMVYHVKFETHPTNPLFHSTAAIVHRHISLR